MFGHICWLSPQLAALQLCVDASSTGLETPTSTTTSNVAPASRLRPGATRELRADRGCWCQRGGRCDPQLITCSSQWVISESVSSVGVETEACVVYTQVCRRYPGFLRVFLQDPQPDRRFMRRGWLTFDHSVNIKEICWNLNNIRVRSSRRCLIVVWRFFRLDGMMLATLLLFNAKLTKVLGFLNWMFQVCIVKS